MVKEVPQKSKRQISFRDITVLLEELIQDNKSLPKDNKLLFREKDA